MNFAEWQQKLLFWLLTTVALAHISIATWIVLEVINRPTKAEVAEMIRDKSPYSQDKKLIDEKFRQVEVSNRQMVEVVQRNTDAINALTLRIESIRVK